MLKRNHIFFLFFSAALLSAAISFLVTDRYMPIEPDAANSPLVWREFASNGFSAFSDWIPTPDNWYFTVYPVNFLVFMISGRDGVTELAISTSLFIAITAIICSVIAYIETKSSYSFLFSVIASALPYYSLTYGFAAHPFSHYSTNAFGLIGVLFFILSCRHGYNIPMVILSCLIFILTSLSDPWCQAAFFMPSLLTSIYCNLKDKEGYINTIILAIGLAISMSHILTRYLGLPYIDFKIIDPSMWIENAKWVVLCIGRSMNIFFIEASYAYLASFLIWCIAFMYSVYNLVIIKRISINICILSFLSISAIITSFVVSYIGASDISARFFMNVYILCLLIVFINAIESRSVALFFLIALFSINSAFSYSKHKNSLHNETHETVKYMQFLNENSLKCGYGEYWKYSNNVNWLSNSEISIVPVRFNLNTYSLDFNRPRSQTMRSWKGLCDNEKRYFVSIPTPYMGASKEESRKLLNGIKQQLGSPSEELKYSRFTILVYEN